MASIQVSWFLTMQNPEDGQPSQIQGVNEPNLQVIDVSPCYIGTSLLQSDKATGSTFANAVAANTRRKAKVLGASHERPHQRRGPRKATRKHVLGLTKREQEVLRHVVSGATNRKISEILSRSQRTVEHHVSAILGKLNVENRMEAMHRVYCEPWLFSEGEN